MNGTKFCFLFSIYKKFIIIGNRFVSVVIYIYVSYVWFHDFFIFTLWIDLIPTFLCNKFFAANNILRKQTMTEKLFLQFHSLICLTPGLGSLFYFYLFSSSFISFSQLFNIFLSVFVYTSSNILSKKPQNELTHFGD